MDYLSSIHARDIQWGRADDFLPEQLYLTTNPLSLPLWSVGLSLCLFCASMKRFRALGWMFIVTFVLFLINKGRGYYTGPAYVMLLAAGCVWFENWLATRTEKTRRLGFGLLWSDAGHRESDRDHPDETDRADQFSTVGFHHPASPMICCRNDRLAGSDNAGCGDLSDPSRKLKNRIR